MKRYWIIEGYGFKHETIFKQRVDVGQFTDRQIEHVLKALTAKAGLDFGEIVGAYAKRKTKIANDHLYVHKDFAYSTYMCGSCPNFTARVVGEDGKIIKHPPL